jgi:hypothetical protein
VTLDAHCFDFYVDTTRPRAIIGLKISAANGTVTIPMTTQTARDIGRLLLAHARHIRGAKMR